MNWPRLFAAVAISICAHVLFVTMLADLPDGRPIGRELGSGAPGGALRVRLAAAKAPITAPQIVPWNDWMERVGTAIPSMKQLDLMTSWTRWSNANGGTRLLPDKGMLSVRSAEKAPEFLKADRLDRKPVPIDAPDFSLLGPRMASLQQFRLRLYITAEGAVDKVETLQAADEDLETIEVVREILRRIRFRPGTLGQENVPSYQDFEFAPQVVKPAPMDIAPIQTRRSMSSSESSLSGQ